MNDDKEWGQKLLVARKSKGLTQIEAGALLSVSYRTYQGWELGEHAPNELSKRVALDTIQRMPDATKEE
jgi:DNA-binding transcriptional regulator YiaG